jgi:DNA-binding HxlR family transcriptional regulator
MDNKTKDAIKQLQAEIRQLHTALSGQRSEGNDNNLAVDRPDSARKEKSSSTVQYQVNYHGVTTADRPFKTGTIAITASQLARVSDASAAELGNALASPQKVALLRALLEVESESSSILGKKTSLSTGSLYHHLRDLMHAGLISQSTRNRYLLTSKGIRVLLTLLALTVTPKES